MSKKTEKKHKLTKSAKEGVRQKKPREGEIPSNSEERIILFAITSLEWQAEYLKPAEFNFIKNNADSLSRALKAQHRDF